MGVGLVIYSFFGGSGRVMVVRVLVIDWWVRLFRFYFVLNLIVGFVKWDLIGF